MLFLLYKKICFTGSAKNRQFLTPQYQATLLDYLRTPSFFSSWETADVIVVGRPVEPIVAWIVEAIRISRVSY